MRAVRVRRLSLTMPVSQGGYGLYDPANLSICCATGAGAICVPGAGGSIGWGGLALAFCRNPLSGNNSCEMHPAHDIAEVIRSSLRLQFRGVSMAKITYIEFNGTENVINVEPGMSVMQGAVKNGVKGIDADCGGACACATCHVYVDPAWTAKTGEQNDIEKSMLDFAENVAPNSRLSCQINVTEELDGLIVRMPESQH
jgi:2Fe-2S ferredoxin